MLFVDFADPVTLGVLLALAVSKFSVSLRPGFDAIVPGVYLLIGGLLPVLTPLWLSTRFRLGLYIDFWELIITYFLSAPSVDYLDGARLFG